MAGKGRKAGVVACGLALASAVGMVAKLHLVKGLYREGRASDAGREERFHYPTQRDVWEVSCEPDAPRKSREKSTTTDSRRRAS